MIWDSLNICTLHKKPLHSEYVTAWGRMTAEFIIGHFFFATATSKGQARSTATSLNYKAISQNYVKIEAV